MPAFFSQFIITILLFIKLCTPFNNFFHPLRTFFHHNLNNMLCCIIHLLQLMYLQYVFQNCRFPDH